MKNSPAPKRASLAEIVTPSRVNPLTDSALSKEIVTFNRVRV